ncbi:MAG: GNAT family N-acetyltransferase [Pirellulales bacterium]|nr:GNAT family N-acetyltransferase [Pirellulales bacterium]
MTAPPIVPLNEEHAVVAAKLHQNGIETGFLSSLGQSFLKQLYIAIPLCDCGFGYAWQEPDGEILGFIACAESTGRLYKQALRRRGIWMAMPLMRYLLHPSVLRRMWHTWRYPSQVGEDLPAAEVLSIAVSSEARGKGVGKALMQAALAEFAQRGINKVKVAVWEGNEAANSFYKRCGFELALPHKHHGLPMNIYTIIELADVLLGTKTR